MVKAFCGVYCSAYAPHSFLVDLGARTLCTVMSVQPSCFIASWVIGPQMPSPRVIWSPDVLGMNVTWKQNGKLRSEWGPLHSGKLQPRTAVASLLSADLDYNANGYETLKGNSF